MRESVSINPCDKPSRATEQCWCLEWGLKVKPQLRGVNRQVPLRYRFCTISPAYLTQNHTSHWWLPLTWKGVEVGDTGWQLSQAQRTCMPGLRGKTPSPQPRASVEMLRGVGVKCPGTTVI